MVRTRGLGPVVLGNGRTAAGCRCHRVKDVSLHRCPIYSKRLAKCQRIQANSCQKRHKTKFICEASAPATSTAKTTEAKRLPDKISKKNTRSVWRLNLSGEHKSWSIRTDWQMTSNLLFPPKTTNPFAALQCDQNFLLLAHNSKIT